jgi:uncharacterized protein YuzE
LLRVHNCRWLSPSTTRRPLIKLRVEHDRKADAVYVHLSDKPYAYGENLDDARRIDYAEDGTPRGIELLYVSQGVDLADLPQADELSDALREHDIRELA